MRRRDWIDAGARIAAVILMFPLLLLCVFFIFKPLLAINLIDKLLDYLKPNTRSGSIYTPRSPVQDILAYLLFGLLLVMLAIGALAVALVGPELLSHLFNRQAARTGETYIFCEQCRGSGKCVCLQGKEPCWVCKGDRVCVRCWGVKVIRGELCPFCKGKGTCPECRDSATTGCNLCGGTDMCRGCKGSGRRKVSFP